MPPTFRAFPQKLSDTLVNVEGKKRVSEDRFAEAAGELNPFTHRTCSCLACCRDISNDSSGASYPGTGLEATTQSAKQKTRDNSIQAPRITNSTVVILNMLASSQRAAGKIAQFLENGRVVGLSRRHRCPNPRRRRPNHGLSGVCSVCSAASFSLVVVILFPNGIQRFRQKRRGPVALAGKPVSHAPHNNC